MVSVSILQTCHNYGQFVATHTNPAHRTIAASMRTLPKEIQEQVQSAWACAHCSWAEARHCHHLSHPFHVLSEFPSISLSLIHNLSSRACEEWLLEWKSKDIYKPWRFVFIMHYDMYTFSWCHTNHWSADRSKTNFMHKIDFIVCQNEMSKCVRFRCELIFLSVHTSFQDSDNALFLIPYLNFF